MKRVVLSFVWLVLIACVTQAQVPGLKWSKYLKTDTDFEGIYDGKRTSDKGYILAGYDTGYWHPEPAVLTKSNEGAGWLVKLDSNGAMAWHRRVGGHSSTLSSVQIVTGGYVVAGADNLFYTDSANYRVAKFDVNGTQLWSKTFGGTGEDKGYAVKATTDGGYIVAGFASSANGDVVKQHAGREAWILKLDANGNKQWAYTYGGSQGDTAYAITQMPDGGYLVGGTSASADGDVPANKGNSDGWVFKINATGTLQWKKNFGGSAQDVLNSIVPHADNTYTLSGYSYSNDGDATGNHGDADIWVIKIDATGNLLWSKLFGGAQKDASFNAAAGTTAGCFVTGFTTRTGGADVWVLRLNGSGNLLWEKSSGTANNEYGMVVMPTNDVEFVVAGEGYPLTQGGWSIDENDGLVLKYSNANSIKGTLYYDVNANGIKDPGENGFDLATVNTQKPGFMLSAIPYNGAFSLDVDTGTFVTSVNLFNPYYTVVPPTHNSTFTTFYNQDSTGFAVQPIANKKDLVINIIPIDPARPGFEVRYQVLYKNKGTVAIPAGTIDVTMDPKFSFVRSAPTPAAQSGTTVSWSYTNLNPLDSATIQLTLRLAAPPAANIGDTVKVMAIINPLAGDETPADDTASLNQRVVASYDPNDKTEANAGIITPQQVTEGDYLHYLIRFQNTGTDTAFNITVRDTLESRLNWSSLQMVAASHPYQLSIEDGNRLSWQFNNIMLPYTAINEPASHGYIAFRIQPAATVQVGDTIKNNAGIYFDFNLPVITNTDRTAVVILAPLPVTLQSFQAVLNGSVVDVSWKTSIEENLRRFAIQRSANGIDFTTIGTVQPGKGNYLFTDKEPLTGYNYYRLQSVDKDGSSSYSTTVLVNVRSEGAVIASIYPNPGNGNITLKLQGPVNGNVVVQVLDQQGRLVTVKQLGRQRAGALKAPIALSGLVKGNYVLRILVNEKVYLQKLLIQ